MARIPESIRQQVIERARGRCEYCQTQQVIVVSMEIDHIIPEAAGGDTTLDNLCFACIGCNGFKLDYQTGIDPDTDQETPLYNPRLQIWRDHFSWSSEGVMVMGLTTRGRATIERLKMRAPYSSQTLLRRAVIARCAPDEAPSAQKQALVHYLDRKGRGYVEKRRIFGVRPPFCVSSDLTE